MLAPSPHGFLSLAVVGVFATGCGEPPEATKDLDLGGGISMSAAGEIKGALPAWPREPPPYEPLPVMASAAETPMAVIHRRGQ